MLAKQPLLRILLALWLAATSGLALAEVYTWVDAQGRRHYGDKPPPGAQQPKLPELNTVPAQKPRPERAKPNDLASCLGQKGFVFYGASWCSACKEQLRRFGEMATRLPYVECSPDGRRGSQQTQNCESKGIEAYPTWRFPNGEQRAKVYSLNKLREFSGCS